MKKLILFFVAIVPYISTPLNYAQSNSVSCYMPCREHRQRVITATAYISSLIASGGIGALTGGFLHHLEKKVSIEAHPIALFIFLLGWALESEVRNDIIIALQRTMDEYGIAYKKGLMFTASRLASWISYLHAYEN